RSVDRLARRFRPRRHHPLRAYAGRERKPARQRLPDDEQVRDDAPVLAREPSARTPEAGVDLVEHEEEPPLVADPAESREPAVGRYDVATPPLHRLDEDRPDIGPVGPVERRVHGRERRIEGIGIAEW